MFGDELKGLRFSAGLTLREFCRQSGEDPSNWSKIERGLIPPPVVRERLLKIAKCLRVPQDQLDDFVTKDEIAAGNIPEFVMTNEVLLNELPAFLRTIDNVKPSEDDFRRLIKLLQESGDVANG
jgi:transcriptional regulator with XRE-family HTH domain